MTNPDLVSKERRELLRVRMESLAVQIGELPEQEMLRLIQTGQLQVQNSEWPPELMQRQQQQEPQSQQHQQQQQQQQQQRRIELEKCLQAKRETKEILALALEDRYELGSEIRELLAILDYLVALQRRL